MSEPSPIYEVVRADGFTISTDKERLDIPFVHRWLSEDSYWAQGRSLEVVERAIANSLCFGLYQEERQVGFARIVTDYATFGWLCDVFVIDEWRGLALGKWLVQMVIAHPEIAHLRRLMLATRDAHELYRRYGEFEVMTNPERWMIRHVG
jgi:GNAT superfamily N-acetyltransferase